MKDLIDYSRETGTGPMESLAKFPRRNSGSAGPRGQAQQHDDQLQQHQILAHNSNGDQTSSSQPSAAQFSSNNGMVSVNNSVSSVPASTTTSTIVGLLHQNSMNSRQNSMNNASSPYGGSSVQIPSPGSSSTMPQAQPNPSAFQAPTPSSSNNPQQTSANYMSTTNSPANISMQQQQPSLSGEADLTDAQSSVQKIIHEMFMSSQMNGTGGMVGVGSLGNDMKNVTGVLPTNAGMNSGNGSYRTMNFGHSAMANGMRAAMGNNSVMNGRGGMATIARDQAMNHQQDLSNQLLSGLGAVNGFNNLQFDWKPSP